MLNDQFGSLGLGVVVLFMLAWLAAYVIDRRRRLATV